MNSINVDNKENMYKQFIQAVEENNIEKVKELIEKGININRQILKKWEKGNYSFEYYITPLILSIEKENYDITRLLLDNNAKVNVNSMIEDQWYKQTAIGEAVEKGNYEIVSELIKRGAKLDIAKRERTPLEVIIYKIIKEEAKKNHNVKKIDDYTNIAKLLLVNGAKYDKRVIEMSKKLHDTEILKILEKKEKDRELEREQIKQKYMIKYGTLFSEKTIESYIMMKEKGENVDIKTLDLEEFDELLVMMDYIKKQRYVEIDSVGNDTKEITNADIEQLKSCAPIYIRGITSAIGIEEGEGTGMAKKHNETGIELESRKLAREYGKETLTNISSEKAGNENRCVSMINYGKILPFTDVGYGIIKGTIEKLRDSTLNENIECGIEDVHLAGENDLWSHPNKKTGIMMSEFEYVDVENLPINETVKNIFEGLKNSKKVTEHNEIVMDVKDKDVKFIFWSKLKDEKYQKSPSELKAIYFQRKYKEQTGRTLPIYNYIPGDDEYLKENIFSEDKIISLLKNEILVENETEIKEVYKDGNAINFLITFKDEINKISEKKGVDIVDAYIKDKENEYSDKNNEEDIYNIVNFIIFVGAMKGEERQQEVFANIFKDINLYSKMTEYFDKDEFGEEIIYGQKTNFFAIEIMSEIRALAKSEKAVNIIMPKLVAITEKMKDMEYNEIGKIKEAVDKNDITLEGVVSDEEQLELKIDGRRNLLEYVLEEYHGEDMRKKVQILVEKYYEFDILSDVLIGLMKSEYVNEQDKLYLLNLLVDKDVDINEVDGNEKTMLHYAADNNENKVVDFLLSNNININKIDEYGKTALHYAAENDNDDIVNELIKNKVDANIKDKYGKTALDYAIENGNEKMIITLKKNIVDIMKDNKKQTLEKINVKGKDKAGEYKNKENIFQL